MHKGLCKNIRLLDAAIAYRQSGEPERLSKALIAMLFPRRRKRKESKLEEMLRLQSPPAGYMMDATSVYRRTIREGKQNRRKREKPRGLVYSDGRAGASCAHR